MGFKLGSIVGKVEEVVIDMDGIGWGEYLRVRVHVNLKKPIPRGRILKLKDQSLWILFQHEKLPKFCFSCGIISHGPGGCIVRDGKAKLGEALGGEYGPWLRVTSNRPWVEKWRGRLGKEMSDFGLGEGDMRGFFWPTARYTAASPTHKGDHFRKEPVRNNERKSHHVHFAPMGTSRMECKNAQQLKVVIMLLADFMQRIRGDKNGKNMIHVCLWVVMLEEIMDEDLLMR
jgi:hypothetical protein